MSELNPITREEIYLASIAGQDVAAPDPITRNEMFLAKIAGMDVATLTPVTRREMFLAALAGQNVTVLDPITREEIFLAAAAGQDVEVPEPITRVEKYLADIVDKIGNPVEFHVIEDGKLIIQGAFSVVETADGLYLDCAPDVTWESPVQTGNVLHVSQVYAATQNGNVLEVT